ncbi:putative C4-dicarboxylate transporter/malic acid transport protein [Magnetofaba australis IT-1]|uniref:Putative C4-dicarboxylate transporter/malic acid transport protein n=1 Tax=Magnetofaba australis IT-1 TaxID=1434232 RepID=A0A1Y2K614_9PROT|nr:putative C4-dicarboxylate transporter/malic acid transport protein [Magnetofaba australis IT-1]
MPISFFAVVMGLCGLTLAWTKGEHVLGLPFVSPMLAALVAAVFLTLAALFLVKLVRHADAVRDELHHPIKLSFFPTLSISMLLFAVVVLELAPRLSHGLWLVGAGLHLGFTLYVLGAWINHEHFQIQHMNPSWFIPVVGNIIVPVAGVAHGYTEISWFFFSIGLLFWLVLKAVVFYRLIFHPPLPGKLTPTLFILIAPPAVGFISYLKLTGSLDPFARILYYAGLFLTLLLLTQARRFARLQFFLSWWAYSFPLAAITIATMALYERLHTPALMALSWGLLGLLCVVIAGLSWRTLLAVRRREICVAD